MDLFFQFDRFSFIMFYLITVLWLMEFILFPSNARNRDRSETRTFLKISAVIIASIALSVVATAHGLFIVEGRRTVLAVISYVTYPLGLSLRYVSIHYLGRHFTRDVEVSETQELVSNGPYAILRHPLYLGLFLLTVSVPLFLSNWLMTIVSGLSMFVVLNERMTIEERMMEDAIGVHYANWKNERYRFIPWVY
ncbi:MAG: methyltransferase family protein [Acholeplasmataceae bacterium]